LWISHFRLSSKILPLKNHFHRHLFSYVYIALKRLECKQLF
jgi:UV DNA damage repair endonuclease